MSDNRRHIDEKYQWDLRTVFRLMKLGSENWQLSRQTWMKPKNVRDTWLNLAKIC